MQQKTTYYGRSLRWWLFLGALAFCFVAGWVIAAQRPAVAQKHVQSVSLTLLFDDAGVLKSMPTVITYRVTSMKPDGVTPTHHLTNIDLDLVAHAKTRVQVGNEIIVIGEQVEEILALAEAMWVHRLTPPQAVVRQRQRENLYLPPTQIERAKMSQADNLRR